MDQFVDRCPSIITRKVRKTYESLSPDIDLSYDYQCTECGFEQKASLPLTAEFFGLDSSYQEAVYEEFFALKHHGGWSLFEVYNLPTQLRRWFIKRLVKEFEDQENNTKKRLAERKRTH